ncbi:MAG: chromosome condensation protein, partial [Planctomycetes bacterium]|nr:chromosome condensation protein [Planctomycetota bacterium]
MADDLLPLPLSPFEFYYWCDDRPDYPTTFPVELMFRGPLRRKAFAEALQVCLDRHPLLN